MAAQQKAYREAHKDQVASQQKAWYEAHKDQVAAQKKAYREAHKDQVVPETGAQEFEREHRKPWEKRMKPDRKMAKAGINPGRI